MSISNTKKAIAGVGVTLGVLIGGGFGFSYHEYKVISEENQKLSGKIHSQGNVIFEQRDLLMKSTEYIEDLKGTKKQLEDENKKVKAILDKQNKNVKKLEKKIDSLEKEVSPTVKKAEGDVKPSGKTINVKATAYTAYCDTGCIGITKTGKDVSNTVYENGNRVVAVDPAVIPLHSKLKIETNKETFYAVALDTGGGVKNKHVDILMENNQIAMEFGVQEAKVTILN